MAAPEHPIITLIGPPGVGKSTLGIAACQRLGFRFLDFSTSQPPWEQADSDEARGRLLAALSGRAGDVVALSWPMMEDRAALRAARQHGEVLLLWDHPLRFHARARGSIRMTPSARIKTRGGFGRRGTACREYRRLDRASHRQLDLAGLDVAGATTRLVEVLAQLREDEGGSPAERTGVDRWVEDLHGYYGAPRRSARVLADAVGRYLVYLQAQGASSRKRRQVVSDLQAQSIIVFMYDSPSPRRVVKAFADPDPSVFARKFLDSTGAVARYEASVEGFAEWLAEGG